MNHEREHIVNESPIRKRKKQILNLGLEELKAICPDLKATTVKHEHIRPRAFDEEITLQTNRTTFRYLLEVKSNVRPETISHMIVLKNSDPKARKTPLLLMADYINPNIAERLKEAGINYIDTVGNLFLKGETQLYLHIEGKKPVQRPSRIKIRLFQPSGITLLFGLLIDPQTVNNPYRQLAKENGVALGTVGWVMRDLREHRFLERSGKKQTRLVRRKDLFDQWVQAYAQVLRPKILIGEYGNLAPHLQDIIQALQNQTEHIHMRWALSGGFGADELLHYYRGKKLTFYASKWTPATSRDLPLVPRTGGDITVLRVFSPLVFTKTQKETECPIAHPLLIYAELLYQGTDRDIETARLLYKEFLEDSLGIN